MSYLARYFTGEEAGRNAASGEGSGFHQQFCSTNNFCGIVFVSGVITSQPV
jgi:hypothetical protein